MSRSVNTKLYITDNLTCWKLLYKQLMKHMGVFMIWSYQDFPLYVNTLMFVTDTTAKSYTRLLCDVICLHDLRVLE